METCKVNHRPVQAFRSLSSKAIPTTLVGQVVKSFSGTIKSELKQQLIQECISLGTRFLGSVLQTQRASLEILKEILDILIKERNLNISESMVEQRRDHLIVILHHEMAYSVIKKISMSVGHEALKDSLADFSTKIGH